MQKQISTHVIIRIASGILSSGLEYYNSERYSLSSLTGNTPNSSDTTILFLGMQNPMNMKISVNW